jgi:hypothetical protein
MAGNDERSDEQVEASPHEDADSAGSGVMKPMLLTALVIVAVVAIALVMGVWFAGEPAPLPFDYEGFE